MQCFVHRDVEAVGTCRACSKGICYSCTVDMRHSISCKGDCEAKSIALNSMISQNIKTLRTQTRNRFIAPVFFVAMGIAFMFFAGDGTFKLNMGTVMGSLFVVFGIVLAIAGQRFVKDLQRRD